MSKAGETVLKWRLGKNLSAARVAAQIGTTRQSLENFEKGETRDPRFLLRLARLMGYSDPQQLIEGLEPPEVRGVPPLEKGDMERKDVVNIPPFRSWEDVVSREPDLPIEFCAPLPDDAMAPKFRAGQVVIWSRMKEPRPGAGILVRTRDGQVHFRQMQQAKDGAWLAVPLSPLYATFHSIEDDLKLVAVFDGARAGLEAFL